MRALVGAEPGTIPATYAKKKGERKRIIGEDDRPGFGGRGGRRPFGRGMRRGMRGRGAADEGEGEKPAEATEAPAAETTEVEL